MEIYNSTKRIVLPVEFYKNPGQKRSAVIVVMLEVLADYNAFNALPYDKKTRLVKLLEDACYEHSMILATEYDVPVNELVGDFLDIYRGECYKITSNLDKKLVEDSVLFDIIMECKTPEDFDKIPKMTSHDFAPNIAKDIVEKIEISKQVVINVKTSSLYKCRKCGKSETTLRNLYIRAADEGTCVEITCQNCGNCWKSG